MISRELSMLGLRRTATRRGKVPCALTGSLVAIDEAHADHAPPYTFDVLANTFLAARGIVPSEDMLTPPADNQFGRTLVDRALAEEWRAYHHRLAHLRITAARANLARSEDRAKASDRQLILGGTT